MQFFRAQKKGSNGISFSAERKQPPGPLKTIAMWGILLLLLWISTEIVCAATYYVFVKPRFGYVI